MRPIITQVKQNFNQSGFNESDLWNYCGGRRLVYIWFCAFEKSKEMAGIVKTTPEAAHTEIGFGDNVVPANTATGKGGGKSAAGKGKNSLSPSGTIPTEPY